MIQNFRSLSLNILVFIHKIIDSYTAFSTSPSKPTSLLLLRFYTLEKMLWTVRNIIFLNMFSVKYNVND